ncbi:MAG: hypothetical protein R2879_20050 [Saprospiraceae bacterium]
MTLVHLLRLLSKNAGTIFLCAFLSAALIFWSTRKEQKAYTSYTTISTGLMSGYNLESSQGARKDYMSTNNELETLISMAASYETQQELAAKLLAFYLVEGHDDEQYLLAENRKIFDECLPANAINLVLDTTSLDNTFENIVMMRDRIDENDINKLLNGDHPFFGLEQISTLKIERDGKSDQIKMAYTTADPGVCKKTLEILTEIFEAKHQRTKKFQSADVLEFFEKATNESSAVLAGKEDALLNFMVGNKIINYYEQTRFIAAKKEDLDELYFKELMNLAAADSTLSNLEKQLKGKVSLAEINKQISQKNADLVNLSSKIARMEILPFDSSEVESSKLDYLRKKANLLEEELKNAASATFLVNQTPQGLETKNLLSSWLNAIIQLEEANAKVEVIRERKKEFEEIYSRFAPWGSKLKRLEREIDVAERAYLENLHSFNQARLHQYNMLMSSNLKIADPPFYPAKPAKSKRGMFIILGFMVGLLIPTGSIIAVDLMDNTLRHPTQAKNETGLEIAGTIPKLVAAGKEEQVLESFLKKRTVEQLLHFIQFKLRTAGTKDQPIILSLGSTREKEGKSFVGDLLAERLELLDKKVLRLQPSQESSFQEPLSKNTIHYQVTERFTETASIRDLIPENTALESFDYILLELPGLLASAYPIEVINQANLHFLVSRSNRTWNAADSNAVRLYQESTGKEMYLILNGTQSEALEESLGEIPKKRSRVRRFLKKAASLNFSGKNKI